MKLPFILRLEPKPHIQQLALCGRPFAYACSGRGVDGFGATPELAWAYWFNDAFKGSPHGLTVLQLAHADADRLLRETAEAAATVQAGRVLDGVHLAIPGDHP